MLLKSLVAVAISAVGISSAVAGPTTVKRQQMHEPIRGVNLGGLFVLEPWITPSLFEEWAQKPSSPVVDEWSYCQTLGSPECSRRLQQHWETWVQEADIYTLATMDINTLRIPIGYWALVPNDDEPYVQGQIIYLKRILEWAAKYDLRVILDLHGVPGSQNGFDNSGRRGDISWTKGAYDIQVSLSALEMLAQIVDEFPSLIAAIQAVNEPANWGVPKSTIAGFYQLAHQRVKALAPRAALIFHDAFLPESEWESLVPNNLTDSFLDTHIYHVFSEDQLGLSDDGHIAQTCGDGDKIGRSNRRVRTMCGEFSLATTDCARWLNGFQRGARWDGSYLTSKPVVTSGTCHGQEDIRAWSQEKRDFVRKFAIAQFQAYEKGSGWIFWNFKTESADAWNFMKLFRENIIPNQPIGLQPAICP
ncbi:hypothetical protein LPJ66_003475 [Kickxella alabastrina]|uniref:Uncharacterized protein n=1 Tax=Kickxella alabastrina TaxID=61397 RepID=A0ACC1ILC3_9FUNG|nr:hypothetical protein LPJ66_003475 [Kickxella alabastrina]